MRILLVNAPSDHPAAARNKLGLWIPGEQLGICYLAACLRHDGHEVELIDAFLQGLTPREVAYKVLGSLRPPDLLGLSISDGKVFGGVAVLEEIQALHPDCHLTLGGHTATLCAREFLDDYPRLNSVVCGEGEWTLVELCRRLEDHRDWHDLPGLAVRFGEQVLRNRAAPLVDLETLPFPARDNLPLCSNAGFCISMETSRGCKGVCSFCATRMMFNPNAGPSWRARSVDSLIEEVQRLIRDHNVRRISFEDEDFLGFGRPSGGLDRAAAFAEEVLRNGIDLKWATLTRVDNIQRDLFALLKRAGLQLIFIGVENNDQETLNRYRKGIHTDQNEQAIQTLRSLDIPHQILWIMYDPYTTFADVRRNVRFFEAFSTALNINLDNALRVYHGTPIYARLAAEGRLRGSYLNWEYDISDDNVCAFREGIDKGLDVPFALVKKLNEILWDRPDWTTEIVQKAKEIAGGIDNISKRYVRDLVDAIEEGKSIDGLIATIRKQALELIVQTASLSKAG